MSDISLDYTHYLDRVDGISGLLIKLRDIKDTTKHPGLLKRALELFPGGKADNVEELRDSLLSGFDSTIVDALTVIGSSQRGVCANLRTLVQLNDREATTDLPVPFDTFYPKTKPVDVAAPDLLHFLLLRPTNQTLYGSIDANILLVIKALRKNIRAFDSALKRVQAGSTQQVLAEVKYEIEALIDDTPESVLRHWLDKSTVCTGERASRRVRSLLALVVHQSKHVRKSEWYPEWLTTLSKLPAAANLFGKHDANIQTAIISLEAELGLLMTPVCTHVPPYIGQLIAEFGYQVHESLETIQNLIAIRALFIKKYNSVTH